MNSDNSIPKVGETVWITVEFRDPDTGGLVDPQEVSLVGLQVADTHIPLEPAPELTRLQKGTFRYALDTSPFTPGEVKWRVRGRQLDGTLVKVIEDSFVILGNSF
jgi:hypothetical protein